MFLLQGGFFDGTVKEVTHDNKFQFKSKALVCLYSPQLTTDDQEQAKKQKKKPAREKKQQQANNNTKERELEQ